MRVLPKTWPWLKAERRPKSSDPDVLCVYGPKAVKGWFVCCIEQSTAKCCRCFVASYLVFKTILFARCSRKYWMNAKTWDPANSLSIVGFLDLIYVQGPLNSSLSPLNANLVSNPHQENVFLCVSLFVLLRMPLHKALHKSMLSFMSLRLTTSCFFYFTLACHCAYNSTVLAANVMTSIICQNQLSDTRLERKNVLENIFKAMSY